jgi:DNA-binding MarR family transcriptional regulator
MAKILAEMVERRYVERQVDPEDSRVKRLRLGARGRAALAAARRFHATFERQLATEVGGASVGELRRLFSAIAARGLDQDLAHARLRGT